MLGCMARAKPSILSAGAEARGRLSSASRLALWPYAAMPRMLIERLNWASTVRVAPTCRAFFIDA